MHRTNAMLTYGVIVNEYLKYFAFFCLCTYSVLLFCCWIRCICFRCHLHCTKYKLYLW